MGLTLPADGADRDARVHGDVGPAALWGSRGHPLRERVRGDGSPGSCGPRLVPIYAAGSGPRMLAAAGRVGDGAIMYASVDPEILRAGVRRASPPVPPRERAPARRPGHRDLGARVRRAGWGRSARDHARGRVASALRHPLPVPFRAEDVPAVERLRREYDAFQHATATSQHRDAGTRSARSTSWRWPGRPEEVREQVQRVMTVPEIGRIILLPQVPGMGFDFAGAHPHPVRRGGHGASGVSRKDPGRPSGRGARTPARDAGCSRSTSWSVTAPGAGAGSGGRVAGAKNISF